MDFVSKGRSSTKGNSTMTVLVKQQFRQVLMIQLGLSEISGNCSFNPEASLCGTTTA